MKPRLDRLDELIETLSKIPEPDLAPTGMSVCTVNHKTCYCPIIALARTVDETVTAVRSAVRLLDSEVGYAVDWNRLIRFYDRNDTKRHGKQEIVAELRREAKRLRGVVVAA